MQGSCGQFKVLAAADDSTKCSALGLGQQVCFPDEQPLGSRRCSGRVADFRRPAGPVYELWRHVLGPASLHTSSCLSTAAPAARTAGPGRGAPVGAGAGAAAAPVHGGGTPGLAGGLVLQPLGRQQGREVVLQAPKRRVDRTESKEVLMTSAARIPRSPPRSPRPSSSLCIC